MDKSGVGLNRDGQHHRNGKSDALFLTALLNVSLDVFFLRHHHRTFSLRAPFATAPVAGSLGETTVITVLLKWACVAVSQAELDTLTQSRNNPQCSLRGEYGTNISIFLWVPYRCPHYYRIQVVARRHAVS